MSVEQNSRPVIGAAMPVKHLETHIDWILEKHRDLELQDFHTAEVLDGDWKPLADRIKGLLAGYQGRLGIHGPFWGFKIDSQDPAIRAVVTKRLLQGLDICAHVGATQMVVHSPYTTWDDNNLDNNPGGRAQVIERAHLTLRDVVARAEELGVVLVIENIEDKNPHDRVELVKSFASSSVRVSIDTGHAHYAHGSTGAPPVDYYVHAAGELLNHIHIQDADGYADRHWVPGEGTIRWHAVFRAVALLNVKPRLILELRDPGKSRVGAEYLAGLGLVE